MIKKLHVQTTLAITVGAIASATLAAVYIYFRTHSHELKASERMIVQLVETVRPTASIAAYLLQPELAKEVLDGLIQNDIVISAELFSQDGIVARSGAESSPSLPTMFTLKSPFDQEQIIGRLNVLPNQKIIRDRARYAGLVSANTLALQTFVVAFLSMVLIYILLTRPLKKLIYQINKMSADGHDRLTYPFGHRKSEIGHLVDDFNDLQNRIEDHLAQERALREDLEDAIAKIQTLRGLLPICASCKMIRDDKGYWSQIETYIQSHSEAEFSHSICPECAERLYPDLEIYPD